MGGHLKVVPDSPARVAIGGKKEALYPRIDQEGSRILKIESEQEMIPFWEIAIFSDQTDHEKLRVRNVF